MKNEIYEIPYKAQLCYSKNKGLILPDNVPYVGMGSSYFAPLVFKYLGINIQPEIASEYYNYLLVNSSAENAVLLSQSGESSETLWCADKIKSFNGIVNYLDTSLANHANSSKTIELFAGNEDFSSTKTYINSLVTLYLGFGFDPGNAIEILTRDFELYVKQGRDLGKRLLKYWKKKRKAIFVIGNGPNWGTALLSALIISETTKIPVLGMPMAQYDHGMKETAKGSMVVAINPKGVASERTTSLLRTVKKAGAYVIELNKFDVEEKYSPLVAPIPFFFAADFMAKKLKINKPFTVGGKVTTVPNK